MVDLGPLSPDPWLPPTLPWPPDTDEGADVKQLVRPVAHRWWFIYAMLWTALIIPGQVVLAVLGSPGGWLLLLSVPVGGVNWLGWRKTRPPRVRADYARIASLEKELLGIDQET